MSYKMMGNNVLVRPIFEEVNENGIIVKQDILPKTLRGEVIEVANHPDCSGVAKGDIVLFHKHAGQPYFDDGIMYKVISMIDLEAVIVEEKKGN